MGKSTFWNSQNETRLTALLAGIFMMILLILTGNPAFAEEPLLVSDSAFAEEPPIVSLEQQNAPSKMEAPPMSEEQIEDCRKGRIPPVMCVSVDVSQVAYPGCTSGKRCTVATSGQVCSPIGMPVKRCQTVNNSGACTCQCIQ